MMNQVQVKNRLKKLIEEETDREVLESVESLLISKKDAIPVEILQALEHSRNQNANLTHHTSAKDLLKDKQ